MTNEQPYFCCGHLPSEGHSETCIHRLGEREAWKRILSGGAALKRTNEYAAALSDIDAPKTVWMAIAFALADFCTGLQMDDEAIHARIMAEWQTLHQNGIVPQRPPRTLR